MQVEVVAPIVVAVVLLLEEAELQANTERVIKAPLEDHHLALLVAEVAITAMRAAGRQAYPAGAPVAMVRNMDLQMAAGAEVGVTKIFLPVPGAREASGEPVEVGAPPLITAKLQPAAPEPTASSSLRTPPSAPHGTCYSSKAIR